VNISSPLREFLPLSPVYMVIVRALYLFLSMYE